MRRLPINYPQGMSRSTRAILGLVLGMGGVLLVGATCNPFRQGTKVISNENNSVTTNSTITNAATFNTNTNSTSEIDTSDWLTYTNEEYGFSFRYPGDWTVTINDASVLTVLDPTEVLKGKGNIESSESFSTMSEKEILLTEPGKETMPLVDEKFLTVNQLPAYRSLRQLKKGDLLRPSAPESTERAESTLTEIEYRYLNNMTLVRLTFTIQGDTYEKFSEIVDTIGQSFSI